MPMTDFLIYVLGIYGLSWLITQSNIFHPLRQKLCSTCLFIPENTNASFKRDSAGNIIWFFCQLVRCIVCTSVWISTFFVFFYFSQELWYTKILIVGTTTTVTWILANLLEDT